MHVLWLGCWCGNVVLLLLCAALSCLVGVGGCSCILLDVFKCCLGIALGWLRLGIFFFFQAEDGIRDHCVTGVQTCALPICAPAFHTAHFLLRQRPRFLYCPFLAAAAPPAFILPNSRCSSAPAFYTDHFSLRQSPAFYTAHLLFRPRPRFLY